MVRLASGISPNGWPCIDFVSLEETSPFPGTGQSNCPHPRTYPTKEASSTCRYCTSHLSSNSTSAAQPISAVSVLLVLTPTRTTPDTISHHWSFVGTIPTYHEVFVDCYTFYSSRLLRGNYIYSSIFFGNAHTDSLVVDKNYFLFFFFQTNKKYRCSIIRIWWECVTSTRSLNLFTRSTPYSGMFH